MVMRYPFSFHPQSLSPLILIEPFSLATHLLFLSGRPSL
jgi:hypothetical protein